MELNDYQNITEFQNPYVIRCGVIGDQGIGKSTMSKVFSTGIFDPDMKSTIGIAFESKTLILPDFNDHKVKVQVWDTAGQEKFRSVVAGYLRGLHIVFLVYDLTNMESWNNLDYWREEIFDKNPELKSQYNYNNTYKTVIVLVGTKSDLKGRVVSNRQINQRKAEWNCKSYIISNRHTSAPSTINRMFYLTVNDLHKSFVDAHINGEELPNGIYKDTKYKFLELVETKKSNCCYW